MSRRRRLLESLLDDAGLGSGVAAEDPLGIGTAGLNVRGFRDEDGSHRRVALDDGRRLILRELATTSSTADVYLAKELAVYGLLAAEGLPAPRVLAWRPQTARDVPGGVLLDDPGGEPLEEVFRTAPVEDRPALWRAVGEVLRRLHDVDVDVDLGRASFIRDPMYQRPWTRFLPYFLKSLQPVPAVRPDLAGAVAALVALRRPLQAYLDERPGRVTVSGAGGYLPGLLVARDGVGWTCTTWLNLGYYVSIADPDRDVVLCAVAHRDWTGDPIPTAFLDAYGRRPDPLCELLYGAAIQLGRGAAYVKGVRRPSGAPPPFTTAIDALDALPETVERLRALLGVR